MRGSRVYSVNAHEGSPEDQITLQVETKVKFHKSLGKSTVHVFVALLRLYFWSNLSKGLWRSSASPKFVLKMDGDYSVFFLLIS